MTDTRFDVLGVGNAIVDVLASVDDAFIEQHLAAGHAFLCARFNDRLIGAVAKRPKPAIELFLSSYGTCMIAGPYPRLLLGPR